MVAADVVGDFAGILEVDGVLAHADGKGADRRFALARGDRADERRIESAREQEADLCVGHQALVDARDELFVDVFTHSLEVVIADLIDFCDVVVADELAVLVIMSGRERQDHVAESCEVFRLAGEDDDALLVEAVVERPDADGVARGDEFARLTVVEDERKFRVEQTEHVDAVLPPKRKQQFTVRTALEGIALGGQLVLELLEAVQLAVADDVAAVQLERLHPLRRQAHDGQPVEAEQTASDIDDAAVVRAARNGL